MTKARELAELGKAVSVHDNRLDFDRAVVIPGLIDAAGTTTIADGSITTAKIADDAVTTAKVDTNIAVAGTLDVTGDLSVTQYIRHVGDTDTHLRFAGANDIRIVSGNVEHAAFDGTIVFNQSGADMDLRVESSNNANMLFVDAGNNRVGIGTNSPNEKLTISSGAISFLGDISTPSIGAGLFRPANNTLAVVTGSTERMRIDSSGNVGIGTSSPNSSWSSANNLVISDTSSDGGMTILSGTSGNGNIMFADAQGSAFSDARGLITYLHASDALRFMTANAERMRIHDNGNVGIGNTIANTFNSQGRNLVVGTGTGTDGMTIFSGSSSYGNIFFADGTSGSDPVRGGINYNHVNNSMNFRVNDAPRIYITSSGHVGIGTASPPTNYTRELNVHGTTNARIKISHNDGGNGNTDGLDLIQSGNSSYMINRESGDILFYNSGSERMRIKSSGYVGIGTSSPEGRLTLGVNTTSSDGLYINNAASGGGELDLVSLGTSYSAHGAGAGEVWLYSPDNINIGGAAGGGNDVKILGDGGERWRMTSDGLQLQNGVGKRTYGGTVAGNGTLSITISHTSAATFKIVAGANHYGILSSYGCAHEGIYANGAGGMYSLNVFNHTSGTHGSWTLTRNSATQFTVNKTAGTYAGGGYYYVSVEGATLS